jgi:hypothetical protein
MIRRTGAESASISFATLKGFLVHCSPVDAGIGWILNKFLFFGETRHERSDSLI